MRRAFTLIELMIVVAIIAIIAAMVLPHLGDKKRDVISYAMKNTKVYVVEPVCMNCKKLHKVEFSVGTEVHFEHACPTCGVKGKLQFGMVRPEAE